MKKFLFAAIAVCMMAVSCKKDNPETEVSISFDSFTALAPEAAHVSIPCVISHELELQVSEDADWISDAVCSAGKLEFNVQENDSGEERKGLVSIMIKGNSRIVFSSKSDLVRFDESARRIYVDVIQAGKGGPQETFALSVADITYHSAVLSYVPADKEMTYIARMADKEFFDTFASDEEYIEGEIEEFRKMAERNGVSLSTVLSANLRKGDMKSVPVDGLKASMDYVVYAYGLDSEGNVLTSMYKKTFTTSSRANVNFKFGISVEVSSLYADVTISADPANEYFYWSHMAKEDWEKYASMDDLISETVKHLDFMAEMMGDPYTDFLVKGSDLYKCEGLRPDKDYVVFAFGIDEYGNNTSGVTYEEFHTLKDEIKDPCMFGISFSDITPIGMNVHVVPSDNNTRYYAGMMTKAMFQTMSPEQAADYFIKMENENYIDWEGDDYIYTGETVLTSNEDLYMGQLKGNTDYTAVVFGVSGQGERTTGVFYADVRTEAVMPSQMTIEIEVVSVSSHDVTVNFTPSDDQEQYYATCVPLEDYNAYGGNDAAFMESLLSIFEGDLDWVMSSGPSVYEGEGSLFADTEYIAVAFGYYGGATTKLFSRTFKTPAATESKAAVDLKVEILDGDVLAESDPATYGKFKGRAVIKATLTPNADAEKWYFKFYDKVPSMSDEELKNDISTSFIMNPDMPVVVGAEWGSTVLAAAVAKDLNGDTGPLSKQILECRKN